MTTFIQVVADQFQAPSLNTYHFFHMQVVY